jgi:hypothetical protein
MYLLYLDASGTPQVGDNTSHYALVGLCVHEGTWFALDRRIRGLKRRYAYPGEDFELHVMDYNTVIDEQDKITGFEGMNSADRRANVEQLRQQRLIETAKTCSPEKLKRLRREFQRTAPFIHLTRSERSRLYEDSLELIGGHRGLVLFGEAIKKDHPAITAGHVEPVRQAFEQVVTRFDSFLERTGSWRGLSRPRKTRPANGLLVFDRDLAMERNIDRQFNDYRRQGHSWGQLRHVIDAPFFVESNRLPGIQIVDACAYALRRYLDKGNKPGSHDEQQFLRISHLFDREGGRLHGLRHYTQSGTCNCLICCERGHGTSSVPATIRGQPCK